MKHKYDQWNSAKEPEKKNTILNMPWRTWKESRVRWALSSSWVWRIFSTWCCSSTSAHRSLDSNWAITAWKQHHHVDRKRDDQVTKFESENTLCENMWKEHRNRNKKRKRKGGAHDISACAPHCVERVAPHVRSALQADPIKCWLRYFLGNYWRPPNNIMWALHENKCICFPRTSMLRRKSCATCALSTACKSNERPIRFKSRCPIRCW